VQAAPYIAVVGPHDANAETCGVAADAGRLIAQRGAVVICGGLGGVMEAAARGASEQGGLSLGILPGSDRAQANPHLTLAVATGLGELRNGLVVRCSDAVLAVGGSWATLSEVALGVRTGMPVAWVRGWSVSDREGSPAEGVAVARSAAEAVEQLFERLAGRPPS
jgi:uncharacterized protein (TIGR00725 family)